MSIRTAMPATPPGGAGATRIVAGSEPAFGTAAEWVANRIRLATMRRVADPWARVPAWAWALRDRRR
jgi:hypothetical protein